MIWFILGFLAGSSLTAYMMLVEDKETKENGS